MDDHKSKYKTYPKVIAYYHRPERVKKLFEESSQKAKKGRRFALTVWKIFKTLVYFTDDTRKVFVPIKPKINSTVVLCYIFKNCKKKYRTLCF